MVKLYAQIGNEVREFTEAEYAQNVKDVAAGKAFDDAKAANDAKVLSAKNKLKALGLTEAEVTALVG
jgi:hypothetical protein